MNNVVPLDDLFRKRLFRVPDYQRGYSWEEQQVEEFLEDLELLGPQRYHYTGTVVLHESDSVTRPMDRDGNTYVPVEIVDGQQRITTIILLLDGISRSLEGFSATASSGEGNDRRLLGNSPRHRGGGRREVVANPIHEGRNAAQIHTIRSRG